MSQLTPPYLSNGMPTMATTNNRSNDVSADSPARPDKRDDHNFPKFHHTADSETTHKLIISHHEEIIREYIVGNQDISIGRKNSNVIQLNDLALSGKHAQISNISGYIFIEDLGSTNGTTVNGNHIKKVALEHGDIIQLGHHQITYLCQGYEQLEPTMFVQAEQDETQIIFVDSDQDLNPTDRFALAGLKVFNAPDSKPAMELRKTYNTIGFQDKPMALITRGSSNYTITAIIGPQSRRAIDIPLLNEKVLDDQQHPLHPGDIINIAGFELQFYFLK